LLHTPYFKRQEVSLRILFLILLWQAVAVRVVTAVEVQVDI
jgi:hypothetical protein